LNTLIGQHIKLRALEPQDLELLFQIENDTDLWELSQTQTPFSKHILQQYLDNAHLDIYQIKQLRLVIEIENNPIGLIDLFDFDPKNKKVGIGIVVLKNYQNMGYATDALKTLTHYCFTSLQMHQVYANILSDNLKSINLFTNLGFKEVGTKKDWIFHDNQFKDEILYQLIHA